MERAQRVHAVPAGFGGDNFPAAIAVHPEGHVLYASNRGHDSIAIFAIDPRTRLLEVVGWEPTRGRNPRHFAVGPTGEMLLVANQDSDTVVAFRIQPPTGALSPTGATTSTPAPAYVAFGP